MYYRIASTITNTSTVANVLSSQTQEAEEVGDVPFRDETAPIITGNEIVAFTTVESPTLETVPLREDVSQNTLTVVEEGRDHSLKDILCREYAFADFTIVGGGASGAILQTWNPLDIFLSQPNVADKVEGFAYLRTDLIIRLEFTTLPTIIGGIMLSFYPDLAVGALTGRTLSRLQLSQVPNIQQSLTTAVSMKMRVPWISPFYARDLHNGFGNIGTVILSRLTPSAGGTVAVKAYISAEESSLKIQYPTPGDILPSVNRVRDKVRTQLVLLNELDPEMYKSVLKDHASITLPVTQSKRETDTMRGGVISGILQTGSKIATVASGIPGVGAIASAAAPLLGIGSALAAAFGLSKPISDKPITAVKILPGDSHLTNEGVLASHEFTINQGCSVDSTYAPFGSAADEMSIEAIMKTPNILTSFSLSTTNPARHIVAEIPLTLHQYTVVNPNNGTVDFTHQAWIASLFNQWNASLNFDFDLYLSHFHRVKLRFLVLPNYYENFVSGTVLPNSFDINRGSSAVVEFSGDNVNWSVRVEPRSITSMKMAPTPIISGSSIPDFPSYIAKQNTLATSYGQLLVIVEVPLQASTTVSNVLYGVVSFSADNVELTNPTSAPLFLPTTQSKMSTLGTSYAKLSRSERMIRGSEALVSNSVPVDNIQNVKVCAGDACIHLRNLLNAFVRFCPQQTMTATSGLLLRPDVRRSITDAGNPGYIDYVDYLTKGYAFYKGSINMRLAIAATNNGRIGNIGIYSMWDNSGPTTVPVVGFSTPTGINANTVGTRQIPVFSWECCIDCNVPFYQSWHIVRNNVNNSLGAVIPYGEEYPNILIYKGDIATQNVDIYRSVGDDFRMGFLMSLPRFQMRPNKAWM